MLRGGLNTCAKGAWPMGISLMGHAPSPWRNGPATTAGKNPRGNTDLYTINNNVNIKQSYLQDL